MQWKVGPECGANQIFNQVVLFLLHTSELLLKASKTKIIDKHGASHFWHTGLAFYGNPPTCVKQGNDYASYRIALHKYAALHLVGEHLDLGKTLKDPVQ